MPWAQSLWHSRTRRCAWCNLGPLFSPDNYFYLNENQVKMEYILRALCGVLPNREMASIIVAHLTFSDVSDRDSAIYLDEPVSVVRSFESELRKKQLCVISSPDMTQIPSSQFGLAG